ncbi:sulfite reductase flavoprotein subunit alpha [Pseudomonas luteola]|uniref:sulfite reductase flavoprotein subunit alpha n=1 Tax=Pseudomonas luteola TaxID=47886 RepID=UPI001EF6D6A3|nr:sulfite reductase flavoprotein subunit alpha [Pseudomonas luteola]MCG7372539.1 sulfite reductase flavoprotein subunit alpha [Pseudomonas luteola]
MKKLLFQLHWFMGITAGLVLVIIGVTGAAYSFEPEISNLINRSAAVEERMAGKALAPYELIKRVEAYEGKKVTGLWADLVLNSNVRVFFEPPPGERRGPMRFVDAYTGEVLSEPIGADFFGLMLRLHRFLAVGETGKAIVGACTLMLVFFCLSGLYLRWPKQVASWRAWLTLDWARKGRSFNWDLHAVAGTWCLMLYLLAALTGLFWSYEWYRNGLIRLLDDAPAEQRGERKGGRPERPQPNGVPPIINHEALWASVQQAAGPTLEGYTLRLPSAAGQPATVFYRLQNADHLRALNKLDLDPQTGAVRSHERYADKSIGGQLLGSIYALHTGEYFGLPGRLLMFLASLAMPLFFITGWLLYLDRRRKKKGIRQARREVIPTATGDEPWLIGFASQSGLAEQLAWQTAGQLQAAGQPATVKPLAQLNSDALAAARKALFIVSTFGDGEAPDNARKFERAVLRQAISLKQLSYGVLALGDRQYPDFCAFGRRLQRWLSGQGAHSLFDTVEVNRDDEVALGLWQSRLGELGAVAHIQPATAPFQDYHLSARQCLNPRGQEWPVFRVDLQMPANCSWAAGDLIEILPRYPVSFVQEWLSPLGLSPDSLVWLDGIELPLGQALATRFLPEDVHQMVGMHAQGLVEALLPLAVRQYSIASLPGEGAMSLIIRQERKRSGQLGIASGWLTAHAPEGGHLMARLRPNPAFHMPHDDRPALFIGNGTGIAGLRALLKARIDAGHSRNWLLFGERNREHDFFYQDELEHWLAHRQLARLDLAFSRDQEDKVYVQDRLLESTEEVRAWVEQGAVIYVCGSLQGMARGVHAALVEILGESGLERLQEEGRYKRDVY